MNESLKSLLGLVSLNGEIRGRKKFQKLVYILKHMNYDFKEDYTYHYYGPYSSTLQMEIDSLVQSDLLKENVDGKTYKYMITDKAEDITQESIIKNEDTSFVKFLNKQPAYLLELISVFFYLVDKGYTEVDLIKKKTAILKPELEDHIDKAFGIYLEIKSRTGDGSVLI